MNVKNMHKYGFYLILDNTASSAIDLGGMMTIWLLLIDMGNYVRIKL